MRAGTVDRVKQQLLRDAVAENLETIRGLPPRNKRPQRRPENVWMRRLPLLLIPVTLLGSSYLVSEPPVLRTQPLIRSAARTDLSLGRGRGAAEGEGLVDSTEPVKAAAFPLAVRRIVLDAGHGGKDAGAQSSTNLIEKDITLDIEHRLAALLKQNGFEVVVTRSDDRMIPLRERARLANESEADIFVSIHVNSLRSHITSHGIETYYLGPTKDPVLTQLAAEENVASGYSLADLRQLLDRVYADVRRDESKRLAASVQQELFTNLQAVDHGVENWGVKRAPFVVLVATDMPAILAEVGCLSNEREAAMLREPDYRQHIAEALFHGINAYARKGT
ncbi:MAG TPA: N-acetylmuramoyl-L-alanine amidase [Thermoanaerobaculia bacterium]|nr:N-acetylmuramoyl-L-alanine amidase [Thermoanaerobaculia bacterium]